MVWLAKDKPHLVVEEVRQGHGVLLPTVGDVRVAANPKNDRLAHIWDVFAWSLNLH